MQTVVSDEFQRCMTDGATSRRAREGKKEEQRVSTMGEQKDRSD